LHDDFAKGIKLHVSDPIITFKETIVNQKLTDKKKKVKGAWEEVESSSEEEEEEKSAVKKNEEEKTLADVLAEYEELIKQEDKEREFLRKELKPDMYIEKILFTKFYRND
jgi:TPP-dependent pyruvate/acetoin dehydrogenase alpha subunit